MHCTNTACTSSVAIAVDINGNVGGATSLAIGADNLPIISYHDSTNSGLKIAHLTMTATGIAFG